MIIYQLSKVAMVLYFAMVLFGTLKAFSHLIFHDELNKGRLFFFRLFVTILSPLAFFSPKGRKYLLSCIPFMNKEGENKL